MCGVASGHKVNSDSYFVSIIIRSTLPILTSLVSLHYSENSRLQQTGRNFQL